MKQAEPFLKEVADAQTVLAGDFSPTYVVRLLCENVQLRETVSALREQASKDHQQAHWFKSLHERATQRLEEGELQIEALKSKVCELQRRLFGRKSERTDAKELKSAEIGPKRPRGQQRGFAGHGRKRRENLPAVEIELNPPAHQLTCERCGKDRQPIGAPEIGEQIEWDVRVFRKRTIRKKYLRHKDCHCEDGLPDIICASPPAALIPKGILGISFIVEVLLEKYLYAMPLHRFLAKARLAGMPLSAGTLCGVLKTITPLFLPIYEGIFERSRQEDLALMDETRWSVFIEEAGKLSHRWWLWVVVTGVTRLFILSPSRSSKVPKDYFGYNEQSNGIAFHKQLMVDRYKAYAFLKDLIELSYCWSHVRRDFLEVRGEAKDRQWAERWAASIGQLYQLNKARISLACVQGAQCKLPAPFVQLDPERMKRADYIEADRLLRQAIEKMAESRRSELAAKDIRASRRKILQSMENHWSGLTLFVDQPQIPMDNNGAERAVRPAAIGRKNFYGSGSKWSGELLVRLMSLLQTLLLHKVDPRKYLSAYLQACADNGSRAPSDITRWLPWNYASTQGPQEDIAQNSKAQGPSP